MSRGVLERALHSPPAHLRFERSHAEAPGDQRARPWRKQKRDRGSYVPSTGPSGPSPRPPSPEQRLGSSLKVFGAASIACVGGNRLERVHDALSTQLVCDE